MSASVGAEVGEEACETVHGGRARVGRMRARWNLEKRICDRRVDLRDGGASAVEPTGTDYVRWPGHLAASKFPRSAHAVLFVRLHRHRCASAFGKGARRAAHGLVRGAAELVHHAEVSGTQRMRGLDLRD